MNACVEDIDYGDLRGLKRAEMAALADAEWIVHQPEYVGGNGGFRKW